MSGCRSPPREWTESVLDAKQNTSMIPYLGGHRQALCGVGRMSTLFLFANRKRRRSFLIDLGEKGTVTRWKNVCACSPPKNRHDTYKKNSHFT